jgi:hypothetical protein
MLRMQRMKGQPLLCAIRSDGAPGEIETLIEMVETATPTAG